MFCLDVQHALNIELRRMTCALPTIEEGRKPITKLNGLTITAGENQLNEEREHLLNVRSWLQETAKREMAA